MKGSLKYIRDIKQMYAIIWMILKVKSEERSLINQVTACVLTPKLNGIRNCEARETPD